ncbi:hypothetical protein ERO13_D05G194200v2 [Gossypium hirsutum]|uniref:Secreted protein n=4 Tax=Gossypium TaxID=3633 RepID=A0A5J5RFS1_GOSBA|nr:hypothetical protein ES319_D05G200300v1 [Gossypium barbadense]KAG4146974.1 hypothetical protein ERO13_D05G194200v2 [Gossypium hirsutum]TYG69174.1 hypothetical protein ES288_D05G210400v1 [Gossypium darwinii]TYH71798.1 hypothetical protein ES332_D05G209900v1 [Gossypium tomentosum]TYI82203.1 hypothetical protein E1A91_D05G205800v1 [Gossypium mustelinum]
MLTFYVVSCLLCLECLNGWDKIVYFDCFLNNFPFYSTCGNKISYIIFIGLQQDVRCTFLLHQLHCLVGSR